MIPSFHSRQKAVRAAILLFIVMLVVPPTRAAGQGMPETELKAEFLFNFAKFTEWPGDILPATAPIVICVTDADVATALEAVVTNRLLGQHPIVVGRVRLSDALNPCAILYVGKLDKRKTAELAAGLAAVSVLTVGDAEAFVESGGMVGFFEAGGRMRFAINPDTVERQRMKLSAKLLALAKIVKGPTP